MTLAVAIGILSPLSATAASAGSGPAGNPALQCRASIGATDIAWTVELEHATPLAVVDSEDTPAQYSDGHVSIRLAANGPNLFIGLHSGRLLVTAGDGSTLGRGMCRPLMSAEKVTPMSLAASSLAAAVFHPSAA